MNRRAVLAIARRDILAALQSKAVTIPMIIVPLVIAVAMPLLFGLLVRMGGDMTSNQDIQEILQMIPPELADRFGVLPPETESFIKIMVVKALSRKLGIRGVESTSKRLILHLARDSRVDPDVVIRIVKKERGAVQLTEDLRIKVQFKEGDTAGVEGAIRFLHHLGSYDINPSIL